MFIVEVFQFAFNYAVKSRIAYPGTFKILLFILSI